MKSGQGRLILRDGTDLPLWRDAPRRVESCVLKPITTAKEYEDANRRIAAIACSFRIREDGHELDALIDAIQKWDAISRAFSNDTQVSPSTILLRRLETC